MTTLVVSPHLDDAVLSIPGFIRSYIRHGQPVVVLTVCSDGDSTHITRRAEDLAALTILGATPLHLGLLDAPQRRSVPPSFRDLILGEPDPDDLAAVTRPLVDRITAVAPTRVLLPLGVGEHLDHRIVHAIHPHLTAPIGFYEDHPYARIEHATDARLLRLGATVDGRHCTPTPTAVDEFLASARSSPHIRAYLPASEREACLRAAAAPLRCPAPPTGLDLQRERQHFSPAIRRLAIAAVQAYTSQLGDLFGDLDIASTFPETYSETVYWLNRATSPTRARRSRE
jgi:LmbE family N-acetylglucosaminyl deacetylase